MPETKNLLDGKVLDDGLVDQPLKNIERQYEHRISRPVNDPSLWVSYFILLLATSSFVFGGFVLLRLLSDLQIWNNQLDQTGISTLYRSTPYLFISIVLFCFGAIILSLWPRLVREKLAWSIILQHSRSDPAFNLATALVARQKSLTLTNVQEANNLDVGVVTAGEWVLDQFSQGQTIVAIPSQNLNLTKIKESLRKDITLTVLHANSEKQDREVQ